MKPAIDSKGHASLLALAVGGAGLLWYFKFFPWLGVVVAVLIGLFSFFIFSTRHMERYRRWLFISIFVFTLISFLVIIDITNVSWFVSWAENHRRWIDYYIPVMNIGALEFPCARLIPETILGRTVYLPGFYSWQSTFPFSLQTLLLALVPFAITMLIFGRGICGWICPFGGLSEAMATGDNERWKLDFLKKKEPTTSGFRYGGLKEWVKDFKYGILVAVILLSIFMVFPIICAFCPALWLSSKPAFWLVIGLIVLLAIVLPFMTKRRWWCLLCPIGAVFSLFDRLAFFRVRINKDKCTECMRCVKECHMYAIERNDVIEAGGPNSNCIRCGRCIEACPEDAIDICWFGTNRIVRGLFIAFLIVAAMLWYTWLIVIMGDKLSSVF